MDQCCLVLGFEENLWFQFGQSFNLMPYGSRQGSSSNSQTFNFSA
jgi:hypothetical protein